MFARRTVVCIALVAFAATCHAARGRDPYAGYAYPAGGQLGTTVRVIVGGQNLSNCKDAWFSGEGLSAKLVEHIRPLTKKELGTIGQHLRVLLRVRYAQALNPAMAPTPDKLAAERANLDPLPDHPWVQGLDKMSLEQLEALRDKLYNPRLQPNTQIAEQELLDVTIAPKARIGERELRLRTGAGMTNPIRFEVGWVPETLEPDPRPKAQTPPVALPAVLNGQIMPGEVDSFRLQARRGQKLVFTTQARSLTPYLADAVPGWFQPTLTLLDAGGKEVAYDDDYRCDPDPVLFFAVPADGVYTLQVKDALYRGREDFVYRVTVGEQPFITSLFPLGGAVGTNTTAAVTGWNLPFKQVTLNTQPGGGMIRPVTWQVSSWQTNPVACAADTLPESLEVEPNETGKQSQLVTVPVTLNGRISRPGDVDVFHFNGRAGDMVVAEVYARRLGSPLDSLLRLIDSAGKVVVWNDDKDDQAAGLIPHQADSYLCTRLPNTGVYYLQLQDAQHHGGEEYGYRLRLATPQPDFALRVSPSTIDIPATRNAAVTVYAIRRDGFAGGIDLALKGAPAGCALAGARIPAGRDQVRLTLSLPGQRLDAPVPLQLEGTAHVGSVTITRPVVPAEYMMQAFAYMHLVPVQQLVACGTGFGRFMPNLERSSSDPVRLSAGGTATIALKIGRPLPPNLKLRLELSDPPKGLTLVDQKVLPDQMTATVKADGLVAGYRDNLIVEVFTDFEVKRPDGKAAAPQRVSVGVLPAIPFEVIKP